MIQGLGKGRAAEAAQGNDDIVVFGSFTLDLATRVLLQNGQPVHIRQRELDLLIYLARRPDRFISKVELIDGVWRGQPVSDANVRVQVAALRRILGDGDNGQGFIDFVSSRGYRFRRSGRAEAAPLPANISAPPFLFESAGRRHNLPVRVKRFFGRAEDCARLLALLSQNRLATIVGPGGIGKTSLALTAAEQLVGSFDDGVRFIDLAGLTDADLVPGVLAAAIGVVLPPDANEDVLIEHLAPKHALFVVDNCEHLIGTVAALVERILTRSHLPRFVCTSREPLRIDGECILRLGPLALPPPKPALAPCRIAEYPSVQLFNDRASQGGHGFQPDEAQLLSVAGLCHRLDGNPLAIELAAARLGLFGLEGLVAQLDESLSLLVHGRRTAVSRHKTLRETIDWSYNLLPPAERRLLNRLSVFRGGFSFEAVKAIAAPQSADQSPADANLADHDLLFSLAELAAKSLINIDNSVAPPQYRLLLLTRDFALERLLDSGEHETVARRHASYFLGLMSSVWHDGGTGAEAWVADVGAAINWSLGDPGDPPLACSLIRASFGVLRQFSRHAERRRLVDRALQRIGDSSEAEMTGKMDLYFEHLHNLQFGTANEAELVLWAAETETMAEKIYQRTGDIKARIELLITRCTMAFSVCDGPGMLRLARAGLASAEMPCATEHNKMLFQRLLAQGHHFCGQHDTALDYIEEVLAHPEDVLDQRVFFVADQIHPTISAKIFKARILWMQGHPALATELAAEILALPRANLPNIACYILAFATIPIALWRGDDIAAREALRQMETTALDQGLGYWSSWGHLYAFVMASPSSDPDLPLTIPSGLVKIGLHADHLATLCLSHNRLALKRMADGMVAWNAPELLRRKAEWSLKTDDAAPVDVERGLVQAVDLARRQNAPAWELRAATSLARFRQRQGQDDGAFCALRDILSRFDPSLPDRDIRAAMTFVAALEQA